MQKCCYKNKIIVKKISPFLAGIEETTRIKITKNSIALWDTLLGINSKTISG